MLVAQGAVNKQRSAQTAPVNARFASLSNSSQPVLAIRAAAKGFNARLIQYVRDNCTAMQYLGASENVLLFAPDGTNVPEQDQAAAVDQAASQISNDPVPSRSIQVHACVRDCVRDCARCVWLCA